MLRSSVRLLAVTASCLTLGLATVACSNSAPAQAPESAASPLLNQPLKPIRQRTLSGEKLDVAALDGKVVVVKFFARYCKPCEKTLPSAQRLHEGGADVAVVGISEDESRAELDLLIQKHQLTFPIVLDRGNVLAGRFRVTELPATFVTNRQGVVVWVGGDQQAAEDIEAAVAAALADEAVATQ